MEQPDVTVCCDMHH